MEGGGRIEPVDDVMSKTPYRRTYALIEDATWEIARLMNLLEVSRLVRTFNRYTNVVSLILGENSELGSKLSMVKSSDLLVKDITKLRCPVAQPKIMKWPSTKTMMPELVSEKIHCLFGA
ncbi:hypothetical protein FNV43_RR04278 [Rhamnella rubrinervis]|uniref:Uncharacterized protein n=1 Tax=Rhamnella rubrinervis TaxID=2594499 RepID=A0A8K0HJG5_9ROSA|nr:hypothetical protein FNV43_RR04278 [Rhamnella rubrinervis]